MTYINDQYGSYASPRLISCAALADFDAFFTFYLDLPIDLPEIWVRVTDSMLTTTHWKRREPPVVGFMKLSRVLTQAPGLSRYVVREFRPADDAPPDRSVCRQLSELIEPASYELLQQEQTVLPGYEKMIFRPAP